MLHDGRTPLIAGASLRREEAEGEIVGDHLKNDGMIVEIAHHMRNQVFDDLKSPIRGQWVVLRGPQFDPQAKLLAMASHMNSPDACVLVGVLLGYLPAVYLMVQQFCA